MGGMPMMMVGKGAYGGGCPMMMVKGGKGAMPMMAAPMMGPNMKDGDWMCPNCGNHNFASRVTCNRCAHVRPGMKQGDWVCRSCKNHNFASRDTCNKCGTPK